MVASVGSIITYDTVTFKVLCTCYALLGLKILMMVPLTVRHRFLKKVVMNPEDCKIIGGLKVKFNDPDVERVRRAHLNDLENITVFIFIAFWYAALKPNPLIAIPLIIAFTLARFAHTYVYAVKVVKQPARFICYVIGYIITAYMAVYIILSLKD